MLDKGLLFNWQKTGVKVPSNLQQTSKKLCLEQFLRSRVLVLQKSHFQLFFMGLIIEVGVSEVVVKALQACKKLDARFCSLLTKWLRKGQRETEIWTRSQ